jgi:hypothetical protein
MQESSALIDKNHSPRLQSLENKKNGDIMKLYKGLFISFFTLINIFAIPTLQSKNPEWKMVDNLEEFSLSRSYFKIQCSDSMNCIVWGASGGEDWCQFFRQTTDGGETWKDIFIDSTYAISEKPLKFKHIIELDPIW